MNEKCEKGKPGPHQWQAGVMVEGITHATCKNCLDEKAYDRDGRSVPVTHPAFIPEVRPLDTAPDGDQEVPPPSVIPQEQPLETLPEKAPPLPARRKNNITEHNQAHIAKKHEEYRAREDEIKEAIKAHSTVAAAAETLKIPVTSIRTMLLRWRVRKVDNRLVPRKDLPKKRTSPKQRYYQIEERREELISIYLREKRAGNTDYGAAKAMGMSASTLVGVKSRWKEDIEKEEMNTNDENSEDTAVVKLERLRTGVEHGLDSYTDINDFQNYWEGLKVGLGLWEIPKT